MRLGPRGKAVSALIFDLLSFGYVALTGWYFCCSSWAPSPRGDGQHRAVDAAVDSRDGDGRRRGAAADRARQDDRRRRPEARLMTPTLEILSRHGDLPRPAGPGMAVPFAISVPAIVYLLVHGGVPALKGIGLMSWGLMNSFSLTRDPAVHPDGRDHAALGPELQDLSRAEQAGLCRSPAACCRPTSRAARCSRRSAARRWRPQPPSVPWPCRSCCNAAIIALVGGLAGGRRHARHPDTAVDRHDRLRHLHRNLGIAELFMAGVIPGLLLTALFMAYVLVHALIRPEIAPPRRGRRTWPSSPAPWPTCCRSHRHRRHHGQPLFRLGDADRGRRRRLPGGLRRLGDLGPSWAGPS